jgi:hypothetical protein
MKSLKTMSMGVVLISALTLTSCIAIQPQPTYYPRPSWRQSHNGYYGFWPYDSYYPRRPPLNNY